MKSFTEYLTESLSTAYPYTKKSNTNGNGTVILVYNFRDLDNVLYEVECRFYWYDNVFDVIFAANGSTSKTGNSPAPMRVFGTIAAIVREAYSPYKAEKAVITFSADTIHMSRVVLYDRLAQVIAREIHGTVSNEGSSNHQKMYYITPK